MTNTLVSPEEEKPPTHYCEVMGTNTEYQRTLNVETDEIGWICVWCQMAKKMRGEL